MSGRPLASDDRHPAGFESDIRPLRERVDSLDAQLGDDVRALFTPLLKYCVERYSPPPQD